MWDLQGRSQVDNTLSPTTGLWQVDQTVSAYYELQGTYFYWQNAFSGAGSAQVSFVSTCGPAYASWYLVEHSTFRSAKQMNSTLQYAAASSGAAILLSLPGVVFDSVCLGNCSNQQFALNPSLTYEIVMGNNGAAGTACNVSYSLITADTSTTGAS